MDWRAYRGFVAVAMAAIMFTGFGAAAPGIADDRQKVVIFHAGSLKVPLAEMEKRFEKKYPSLDIVREFGGYRSLMVLQLAEKYYNQPGLYARLIANRPGRVPNPADHDGLPIELKQLVEVRQ